MSRNNLPKLVVFDLDYTLWPFWVDTHVSPPFRKNNGVVHDSRGAKVRSYPESNQVIEHLRSLGCEMAVASRTAEVFGANQLIQLFDWDKYFKYKEIYPGCKKTHFEQFKKLSGIDYKDMLFFDDEHRNIRDLTEYGVTCILVKDGMNLRLLEEGLTRYRQDRR